MNELVSIIIPTYKGKRYLSRAIESVLAQTYTNIEIIVVDDNDPDSVERSETELVMAIYSSNNKIKYIKHEKNMNGSVARNTGLRNANGEYITFLDDDDIYFPERISKCLKYLLNKTNASIVYSDTIIVKDEYVVGYISADKSGNLLKELFCYDGLIGTGSNIIFHRSIYDELGGFDERLLRHQDYDFLLKCFNNEREIVAFPECLVVKATNGTSNILNYKKMSDTKEYLFDKYKDVIENFDEKTYNSLMRFHHLKLLEIAKQNEFDEGINREIEILSKLGVNCIANTKNIVDRIKKINNTYIWKMYSCVRELKLWYKYGDNVKKATNYLKLYDKLYSEKK